MMRGHIHLNTPRQPIPARHHRNHRIHLLGRPSDHRLPRRGIHRHPHLRIIGNQPPAVASASNSTNAIAPRPDNRDINRDRVAITRNPSAADNAPATTAAVTSPIE